MFQQIRTVARNTFTESIRQPIFLVMLGAVIIVLFFAMNAAYTLSDDNKMMVDISLSAILIGGAVLGAFIAAGVLSREIENKTVLSVISKPISRTAFVLGKYVGVMGAISLAYWVWSIVFLLEVRHKVMSTAADTFDMPVILFGLGALVVALVVAVWGNYFYNWVFTSRFVGMLAGALTAAYVMVLLISKEWHFQSITHEFTADDGRVVQIVFALLLLLEGLAVICALAVACSTRLGQVMTLLICLAGCFLGLSVDYFLGAKAMTSLWAKALYAGVFNMQYVWLADALTQHHPVTAGYIGDVTLYTACYAAGVLCLAVALFQTRETG